MRFMVSRASMGARDLSNALGIGRRVNYHSGNFTNMYNHLIINWGCSQEPVWPYERMINKPSAVSRAINKDETLLSLGTLSVPFSISGEWAREMVSNGEQIIERHTLTGSKGRGIRLVDAEEDISYAPLYTKYFPNRQEFRIHVAFGNVFDKQQRLRKTWDADMVVRSHDNGWIFARYDIEITPEVENAAIQAVSRVGLDFGAVDLLVDEDTNEVYVLEINTAPALVNTTLVNYTNLFRKLPY